MKLNKMDIAVKEIAKLYFIALRNIDSLGFSNGNRDEFSPFYKYYIDVETAFNNLNSEQKRLINNDYFHQAYLYWWTSLYKKNQYLKLKKASLARFLEVFHAIHC